MQTKRGSDSGGDEKGDEVSGKASEEVPRNFWLGVRFAHDVDMPKQAPGLVKTWTALMELGQDVDEKERELFEREWIANCELKSNRELVSLTRGEGGIGGNNNATDRQVRFACSHSNPGIRAPFKTLNQLVIQLLHPYDANHRTWTWAEVRDVAEAFQKTLVSRLYLSATSGTCEYVDCGEAVADILTKACSSRRYSLSRHSGRAETSLSRDDDQGDVNRKPLAWSSQ